MVDRSSSFTDKEAQYEERTAEEESSPFAVSAEGLALLNEVSLLHTCIDEERLHGHAYCFETTMILFHVVVALYVCAGKG